jgi:hypothetical protein
LENPRILASSAAEDTAGVDAVILKETVGGVVRDVGLGKSRCGVVEVD